MEAGLAGLELCNARSYSSVLPPYLSTFPRGTMHNYITPGKGMAAFGLGAFNGLMESLNRVYFQSKKFYYIGKAIALEIGNQMLLICVKAVLLVILMK